MNHGYIKLYRKVMDSFVWTNPQMFKLWMLCLMKASHDDRRFLFNGQEIRVSSGQFVTGRDALGKEYNEGTQSDQQVVSRTLWRWMKKFENEQMLSIKSTTKYSIISINNWNEYQVSDQQLSSDCPSTVQHLSTYKNDKNDKNDKNNNISSSKRKTHVYAEDSIYYQLANKLFGKISQNQNIKKPNLNSWADDIRKMIKIDKRSHSQVSNMIEWCTTDSFWSTVVLSAKKLRDKYDTMAAQANREYHKKSNSYQRQPIRKEKLPDWADKPQVDTDDPEKVAEINQRLQEYLKNKEESRNDGIK